MCSYILELYLCVYMPHSAAAMLHNINSDIRE